MEMKLAKAKKPAKWHFTDQEARMIRAFLAVQMARAEKAIKRYATFLRIDPQPGMIEAHQYWNAYRSALRQLRQNVRYGQTHKKFGLG